MKLTRKFIATLIVSVSLVATIGAWFDYRRESSLFEREIRNESASFGRVLAHGVADVWNERGEASARDFLDAAASRSDRIHARWVWLDELSERDKPTIPAEDLAEVVAGRSVSMHGTEGTTPVLRTYVPVAVPGPRAGALELTQPTNNITAYVGASLSNAIWTTLGTIAITTLLAAWLGLVFIGRPIAKLAAKARRTGAGDLSEPLHLAQRDELRDLAEEFNAMCDRLSAERAAREAATAQLRHLDRLTTVGQLAAGMAHELGTPLNVVSGRARLIADGEVTGEDATGSARIIIEQSERMTVLIRQLLDFARPRAPAPTRLELGALGGRVCNTLAILARKAEVKLVVDGGSGCSARGDDGQLSQVVTNLVVNAIHASSAGSEIHLRTGVERATHPTSGGGEQTWATLTVEDTGVGMDEATRNRVFEPFFTTKPVGEGSGLGLSVSWGIVHEHGGWIAVRSAPGRGSAFTMYVPIDGDAPIDGNLGHVPSVRSGSNAEVART